MKPSHYRSLCLAGAALVLAACVDRDNPAGTEPRLPDPVGPPGRPVMLQALECRANVRTLQVQCGNTTQQNGLPSYLIVGGQDQYVTLTSSNVNYDEPTQAFTMNVTVRNLIPQPLGTADTMPALTPDPAGIRVFFNTEPVVTLGSGTITMVGTDTATFTEAGQHYYQYPVGVVLEQFEVSGPMQWEFTVPNTVQTFYFGVYVAAAVPWPDGYVRITGNFNVRSGNERQLTARAYNVVGEEDATVTSFTWTALDSTRARVDPATGLLHGQRFGSTGVVATAGDGRHGTVVMNVAPIRRYWTGAAGVTNWENGVNWLPDSIAPQAEDTAVVPDTTASIFPVLTQNEQVGGVEVLDLTAGGVIPTVSLGAFNLTATGDVMTINQSEIDNTVGRLFLSGAVGGHMVEGNLPFVTVTGSYALSGNMFTRASLRVQGGRLRNQSFRIRTQSF